MATAQVWGLAAGAVLRHDIHPLLTPLGWHRDCASGEERGGHTWQVPQGWCQSGRGGIAIPRVVIERLRVRATCFRPASSRVKRIHRVRGQQTSVVK